jgi:hypothetical protein
MAAAVEVRLRKAIQMQGMIDRSDECIARSRDLLVATEHFCPRGSPECAFQ